MCNYKLLNIIIKIQNSICNTIFNYTFVYINQFLPINALNIVNLFQKIVRYWCELPLIIDWWVLLLRLYTIVLILTNIFAKNFRNNRVINTLFIYECIRMCRFNYPNHFTKFCKNLNFEKRLILKIMCIQIKISW